MVHIKLFSESINEGVRDKMTPKSSEDVIKALEKMLPYRALSIAYKYELPELIKIAWERVKPINEKLYQDTKKFNKKNIDEFMDFITIWIDDQGGDSCGVQEDFENISFKLGAYIEEEEERPTGQKIVDSIYSDNTIEMYKQLVISYVIDYMSHNTYGGEEEDGDGDDGPDEDWEEEEIVNRSVEQEEMATPEELSREQKIQLEVAKMEKEKKEKKEKKPINKIKKFLGFDKKDEE